MIYGKRLGALLALLKTSKGRPMDRPLYALKGPSGLCWWTVRPTPRDAWDAGYPKAAAEPEISYGDRLARIQKSELIECVRVTLEEAK